MNISYPSYTSLKMWIDNDKDNGRLTIRPKEKYALFPVTCPKFLGSVGRQTFLFIKTFLYGKSMKFFETV